MAKEAPVGPVVYFDGLCGLCDRSVALLLRADRNQVLAFAPLQGTTAAEDLAGRPADDPDWIVYRDEDGIHLGADAVLRILERIGGPWRLAARVLGLVPPRLRNGVYARIAARRQRWFGQLDACRTPAPGVAERFLP